jgi:N-acetylglucosaminyl-diphospho-decaprenol L-rhamnosyltransferase
MSAPATQNASESQTSSAGEADVTVCIVSHRHFPFLRRNLDCVFSNTHNARLKVVLVDNVGEPEIPEMLAKHFPQVRLIVNDKIMGFSANNNQVILDAPTRYSFMLNPDTETRSGAIDHMVEFMDANPKVGACGPKLIHPDGGIQLSARRFPTLGAFLVRRTPLRLLARGSKLARSYEMADKDHDQICPIDWLFGAAIFIRRECLASVGGLDEGMFMYSEDVDWCLRCWQAGWPIYFVADSVIVHHIDEQKYNNYFTRHRLMHYQSMLRYIRKHWRTCLRWSPPTMSMQPPAIASTRKRS